MNKRNPAHSTGSRNALVEPGLHYSSDHNKKSIVIIGGNF